MKAVRIRLGLPSDLPVLEEIEEECFMPARRSSRRVLRHSLRSRSQTVWIAEAECGALREPVGAMVLHHRSRAIRVFSVAVRPGFRNQGGGRQLLQEALERARCDGLAAVSLEADRSDARLRAWYEGFGFRVRGVLPDYYAPGHDAVRMRLRLEPAHRRGGARGGS